MTGAQQKRTARRAQTKRDALLRAIDSRSKPRIWRIEHDDGLGPYIATLGTPGWPEVRAELLGFTARHRAGDDALHARLNAYRHVMPLPLSQYDPRFGTTTWAGLISYFGPHLFTLADYGFSLAQVEVPRKWVVANDQGVVAYAARYASRSRRFPLERVLQVLGEGVMERVLSVQGEMDFAQFLDTFGEGML